MISACRDLTPRAQIVVALLVVFFFTDVGYAASFNLSMDKQLRFCACSISSAFRLWRFGTGGFPENSSPGTSCALCCLLPPSRKSVSTVPTLAALAISLACVRDGRPNLAPGRDRPGSRARRVFRLVLLLCDTGLGNPEGRALPHRLHGAPSPLRRMRRRTSPSLVWTPISSSTPAGTRTCRRLPSAIPTFRPVSSLGSVSRSSFASTSPTRSACTIGSEEPGGSPPAPAGKPRQFRPGRRASSPEPCITLRPVERRSTPSCWRGPSLAHSGLGRNRVRRLLRVSARLSSRKVISRCARVSGRRGDSRVPRMCLGRLSGRSPRHLYTFQAMFDLIVIADLAWLTQILPEKLLAGQMRRRSRLVSR